MKSAGEMEALFPYAKEAIENTHKIAERCHVEIEFGDYKLPHFDVPEGETSESYRENSVKRGFINVIQRSEPQSSWKSG